MAHISCAQSIAEVGRGGGLSRKRVGVIGVMVVMAMVVGSNEHHITSLIKNRTEQRANCFETGADGYTSMISSLLLVSLHKSQFIILSIPIRLILLATYKLYARRRN